jgi:hypothetical protein
MLIYNRIVGKNVIWQLLVVLLLSTMFIQPPPAKAADDCECVEYIKRRYSLSGAVGGSGGAKDMGPYLLARGFTQVSNPVTGAVVIFQPAFGDAADPISGHVGVITLVTDKDTKWKINVTGSNQGGSDTEFNCYNVNNIGYPPYLKSWGTDYIAYYLPPGATPPTKDFNSNFSNNANGWSNVRGNWTIADPGYYSSPGQQYLFSSTVHTNNFPTLTYTVKMKRTGCSNCGNYIYFRGTPGPLNSDGRWSSGYILEYSNNGYYTIGEQVNGNWVTFINWTYSPSISSGWNTLKVTAKGTYLQFFINGTLLAYGNDPDYGNGRVGIGFHRQGTAGKLIVDNAKLVTSAPGSLTSSITDSLISHDGSIDITGLEELNPSDPGVSP